ERFGLTLQNLREALYGRFGKACALAPMEEPTPVLVLRNESWYWRYNIRQRGQPLFAGGHFEPSSKRLVVYLRSQEEQRENRHGVNFLDMPSTTREEYDRMVVFHEGTHQIVDHAMRNAPETADSEQAFWFSEGFADYFGGYGSEWDEKRGRARFEPGRINLVRLEEVHAALKDKRLIKLHDLLDYRRSNYQTDYAGGGWARISLTYAQGWALCYLLDKHHAKQYQQKFVAYLKEEFAGRSGRQVFLKIFGTDSLGALQREYEDMIEELAAANAAGKIVNGVLVK
ncbi:MAG: hypothetical protein CL908_09080, partial [Deltaproteobacteria bacterium]|nr:hypothetical protein [Deltaproteobacteria bacterium]